MLAVQKEDQNKMTASYFFQVPFHVSNLTGLDNDNLEDQKRFSKESGQVIRDFLALLQKPICLLAHNGNR